MTYAIDIARCNATLAVKNILSSLASDLIGPAGGDLSGLYPNPTVAKINGVALGSTTATSGNILIGSGSAWVTNAISGDITISNTGVTAIGANKVTDAMLRESSGLSIIGRSANTTGNVADIIAASDFQVMRRSGTSIAFGAINLASTNAVSGILANANTTATSVNTVSTIVARDASGNFSAGTITADLTGTASTATVANTVSTANEASDTTCFPLFVTASGTQSLQPKNNVNLRYNASTNLLAANLMSIDNGGAALSSVTALLTFGASVGAGNYINYGAVGGQVPRSSGVSDTGSLYHARNAIYNPVAVGFTYGTSGSVTLLELSDTALNLKYAASGTVGNPITFTTGLSLSQSTGITTIRLGNIDNGGSALTGTNAALTFGTTSALADGNYINFGTGGRNIGVINGGAFFKSFNADYDATSNVYKYNTSSVGVTTMELGATSIDLKYAASGTAGATVTPSVGLSITTGGNAAFFGAGSFGSGTNVIFIANAAAVPSTNPSGGGILYTSSGLFRYRSSNGIVTNLANDFVTLTDAATVAVDLSLGNNFNLTLGGSRTLGVPTNVFAGQNGLISVRQDSTGSRTLSYSWVYEFGGGAAPTLSTGKFAFDQLYYAVNNYATSTVTMTIATPCVVTWTSHGLISGQKIQLTTTGALPTGLSSNTTYWVNVTGASTFNLSSSLANLQAGTFINTSGSQSGTHTAVSMSITISANFGIS